MDKLCILSGNLNGGGAEKMAVLAANAFADMGVQVQLVLMQNRGVYFDLVSRRVEIVLLESFGYLRAVLPFMRYLRRERPDGVLAYMPPSNCVATLANRLTGRRARVVVTEHNTYRMDRVAPHPLKNALIKYSMAHYIYPLADAISCVSQGASRDLEEYAGYRPGRVVTVYNPVVSPDLPQLAQQPAAHPWLDGSHEVVIAVGRLSRQKNLPLLLHAFAKLRTVRASRLLLLGEGEQRAELEQLVSSLGLEDAVELPGFIPNPYACMKHAQLFVLSSDWEGLPSVLIEALALGVPVVATDCPSGPREILKGGAYGTLVAPGDVDALAAAMEQALAHPEEVKNKAHLFQQQGMEPYTGAFAAKSYLRLLQGKQTISI